MTLTQLTYIVAVAQHRNFGAAAEASHITQPTLSMQIQKLEEELGVIIFDRSAQPIRTTSVGEQIIVQARITLVEAQKIGDLTATEQNEVAGEISIGVIPTLSPYLIPLFVQKFADKYPKAQISIEELQTEAILKRLRQSELDIGLLVTPVNQATLVEHPLFYEPFLLYVSPRHPLMQAKKVREKDLNPKDVWLLTEGHCFRDQVIDLCGESAKLNVSHGNLRFESGNLETLKKMVDQGEGFTLLPLLAAREIEDPLRKRQIKEFHFPVPTREVSLVQNKLFKKRATVEALLSSIREALPIEILKLKNSKQHRIEMRKFE